MSDFKALKAAYIALAGKNPPPMSADALRAKVDELAAAAAVAPAADAESAGMAAEGAAPSSSEANIPESPAVDAAETAAPETADEASSNGHLVDGENASDEQGSEAAEEQSLEETCSELGIVPDAAGNATVVLLVSLAGAAVKAAGEDHHCGADEAVRMVRAGFAKPRG